MGNIFGSLPGLRFLYMLFLKYDIKLNENIILSSVIIHMCSLNGRNNEDGVRLFDFYRICPIMQSRELGLGRLNLS
jgi:hypothetical protein